MRAILVLSLVLVGACAPPKYRKFDRFVWPQAHSDVLWLLIDGQLHRCWQHAAGGPVCMVAVTPPNPVISPPPAPRAPVSQPAPKAPPEQFPAPPDYTR